METRRGTTPTLLITTNGIKDLSQCDVLWITLKQGNTEITKEKSDLTISGDEIELSLTQEETLLFKAGSSVSLQLRALIGTEAVASDIKTFRMEDIIKDGIIA